MPTDIDLRDWPQENHRDQLFDALRAAESGDELEIVAPRDIDPDLVRFQIESARALSWEYADPDGEPRNLDVTVEEPIDADEPATIDVRDLKPQRRHQVLLEIFDDLAPGEEFILINDHDPKPLYYELQSMHGEVVGWEYGSRGSGEWRVMVTKTGASAADNGDVVTQYDVREIPKQERHTTIHHRYGMIPDGGTMEIIAPHEPRPLRQEFRQRYDDSFSWNVVESDPGRCRVQITKTESVDERGEETPQTGGEEASSTATMDEEIEITEELDVRDLPPAQRHEQIFDTYVGLDPGEGFVLVNDHDPKPLYHQFEAEAGDEFHWEYRLQASGEFRVLIGKENGTRTDRSRDETPSAPF
ncbi:DUF2249 domain-containing protein [Halobaculum magnesiiphilum]|uniref:DUF2249 domain-containing protein n=1 Tax=Halobaculum magnesiiphilum TaxID=1017351 RepID=A0A8T8WIH3_9EURY|nr:DUF2249 domain-containing protein [Halobaculum magnesiiphilum]QZP39630.1 DUF2249 domain-containing protein [Halobaculum magnesiiphilum]